MASEARADGTPRPAAAHGQEVAGDGSATPEQQRPAVEQTQTEDPKRSPVPENTDTTSVAQADPMSTTNSSSSEITVHDSATPTATGPTPYGTRSRNKSGAQRPNYAEDHDMDIDSDSGPTPSRSKRLTPAAQNGSVSGDNERASGISTRRNQGSAASAALSNGTAQPPPKDPIPGTSTFSANPTATTHHSAATISRKRKQLGGGAINAGTLAAGTSSRTRGSVASSGPQNDSNMMTFEINGPYLKNGRLKADDGTVLSVNDHVYLICEPPGEPYYLARVMEFLPSKSKPDEPIEAIRVNWYYRPRDIQRKVTDTRVVFASMHSDTCPLTSLRGKCQILHSSEIPDLDEYRKTKDNFWYEKMFDRYIHRYYEVIPTSKVINVPQNVKAVLDERWRFVIVEIGRGKELTAAVKTCKRCGGFCANHDSVDCAVCRDTYHMTCVRPVLQKKPARGFAWACAPCSRAQDRRLEARNTPIVGESPRAAEDEVPEEEEEDRAHNGAATRESSAPPENAAPEIRPATAEQIAQAKLWPYRYLGIHCRVEDALDYDDRIYPRASSRLGPRHQANVNVWHGRPVELVKPAEIKRKYMKGGAHKKETKLSKETIAALEADKHDKAKRPKWVMDEPLGYIPRGEDGPVVCMGKKENTARLLFKMPDPSHFTSRGEDDDAASPSAYQEKLIKDYMKRARRMAPDYGLPEYSTNFLDKALEKLYESQYDAEEALKKLKKLNIRADLKEPELSREEIKRFEEGVAKYGSELHSVTRHVGTVKEARIVRFYYSWKKTDRGRQIWGNYEGRRGKKEAKKADANTSKLVDDVADDHDDSAFDNDKAAERKRGFECKFCGTRKSRQWRRAPGVAPGTMIPPDASAKSTKDKSSYLTIALCHRCAGLWRKYGIQWENMDEVARKVAQGGGRAWKRRIDEELLNELVSAQEESGVGISTSTAAAVANAGIAVPTTLTTLPNQEPARKKNKADKEAAIVNGEAVTERKKPAEKVPEPALKAEPPRIRALPCAVCYREELPGQEMLSCRDCRLTVHRGCYGVSENRSSKKWVCDMCSNDRTPLVSTSYECVLCPVRYIEWTLMEPPRVSHKKKTDREREKERKEKEMTDEAIRLYRQQQESSGRPVNPREPLKRTAGNNWVHVACALWTPEIKFGTPSLLEPAEGIGSIPSERYTEVCKICKQSGYPTVKCHQQGCAEQFHIGCALQQQYLFAFDITPVKSTRKDVINTITLKKETGNATAVIYCPGHSVSSIVHEMWHETDIEGMNALQLFARTFKQADQSVTGTVRKAASIQLSSGATAQAAPSTIVNRRASTINGTHASAARSRRTSPDESMLRTEDASGDGDTPSSGEKPAETEKQCYSCGAAFSPKWWPVERHPKQSAASVHSARVPVHAMSNGIGPDDSVAMAKRPISATGPPSHPTSPSFAPTNGAFTEEPSSISQAVPSIDGAMDVDSPSITTYQCHKCHVKKRSSPPPPPEPEVRRSPQQPPMLHRPSLTDHPPPPLSGPHAHPGVPSWSVPMVSPRGPPYADHRPPEYANPMRNGIPQPNGLHRGPPPHFTGPPPGPPAGPPPPPHAVNGYGPPQYHPRGPPAYPAPNGIPSYSPRQPHLGPPTQPLAYAHQNSPPPDMRPSIHGSPQMMTGPPRGYVGPPPGPERSLPPHRQSLNGGNARATTPAADEPRPGSSGRYTAASASPSLRNLLS